MKHWNIYLSGEIHTDWRERMGMPACGGQGSPHRLPLTRRGVLQRGVLLRPA